AGLRYQLSDIARLRLDFFRRHVDFHVQRRADAYALRLGGVGVIKKIPVESRNIGEPWIAQCRFVDDMQMSVDDHGFLLCRHALIKEWTIQIRISFGKLKLGTRKAGKLPRRRQQELD